MNSIPVVFVAVKLLNQTIKKQKDIGVQEINIIDIVKPITKFSIMITDPNSINYYLKKLMISVSQEDQDQCL